MKEFYGAEEKETKGKNETRNKRLKIGKKTGNGRMGDSDGTGYKEKEKREEMGWGWETRR